MHVICYVRSYMLLWQKFTAVMSGPALAQAIKRLAQSVKSWRGTTEKKKMLMLIICGALWRNSLYCFENKKLTTKARSNDKLCIPRCSPSFDPACISESDFQPRVRVRAVMSYSVPIKRVYSFGGDFKERSLHTAAVKCYQMCTCDRVRHHEDKE